MNGMQWVGVGVLVFVVAVLLAEALPWLTGRARQHRAPAATGQAAARARLRR